MNANGNHRRALSVPAGLSAHDPSWSPDSSRMAFSASPPGTTNLGIYVLDIKAGTVRILLNQDDGAKGFDRVKGEGFSLQFITSQSVDDIANRIKAHGASLDTEPADMPWGVRSFRVRDPDGFRFAISSERRPNE